MPRGFCLSRAKERLDLPIGSCVEIIAPLYIQHEDSNQPRDKYVAGFVLFRIEDNAFE